MALSQSKKPELLDDPSRVRCSGSSRESRTIWIRALLGWRIEFVFRNEPGYDGGQGRIV